MEVRRVPTMERDGIPTLSGCPREGDWVHTYLGLAGLVSRLVRRGSHEIGNVQ